MLKLSSAFSAIPENLFNASSPPQSDVNIEPEILDLFATYAKNSSLLATFSILVIAVMAYGTVDNRYWSLWLIAALLCQFLRWFHSSRLLTSARLLQRRRLTMEVVINVVSTLLLVCSLSFFPHFDTSQRVVLSLLFILTGISVFWAAGFFPLAITFLLLIFFPLIAAWQLTYGPYQSLWIELLMPSTALVFGFIFIRISDKIFSVSLESIHNRKALEKANEHLLVALQQAESAAMAKTRFLAAASHDLRQPIHSLTLFCSALNMKPLDGKVKDIVSHISIAVESLGSQLDAILDVSKLDAGLVPVNKSDINLFILLTRVYKDFRPLASQKGLLLNLDCPNSCTINTDSNLLERILRNLLSNAVKYTDDGGIKICVRIERETVSVSISDTGIGIPLDEQEHIFEEFYQLTNTERDRRKGQGIVDLTKKDRRKGLGLGLSIVRRHAKLLGIDLKLTSQLGEGSEFSFTLKISLTELQAMESKTTEYTQWSSLSILVVDDEGEVRHAMKVLLETLGCEVTTVDSTRAALDAVSSLKPDIALVDFRLGGDDSGLTTIAKLREQYPSLPAIIISGDTAPERLTLVENAGIEMLHKPVMAELLKHAIVRACNI